MIKIALCIPTYNREKVVNDFLNNCALYYIESGIDIYYYDSSPNNYTKELIFNWNKENPEIRYIRMPEEMHSNLKVYKIYQGYGLAKEYDFIWVCGDALQFSEHAINQLYEMVDKEYDIIQLDGRDYGKLGIKIYDDYNEYLEENAWEVTMYGSVLLNSVSMLKNVDWPSFEKKYSSTNLINFTHVSFYFNRICELETFKALHISIAGGECLSSSQKKQSGWQDQIFFVFCRAWVDTIEMLPSCYTQKQEAIIKHGRYTVFRNLDIFMEYRMDRVFKLGEFIRYYSLWNKVCDISRWKLLCVSVCPVWLAKIIKKDTKKDRKKRIRNVREFCRKHKKIYLYGAGIYASRYFEYLEGNDFDVEGFVVSNGKKTRETFYNHKVVEIDELENQKEIGVIVAVESKWANEILDTLSEYKNIDVLYDKNLYSMIKEMC